MMKIQERAPSKQDIKLVQDVRKKSTVRLVPPPDAIMSVFLTIIPELVSNSYNAMEPFVSLDIDLLSWNTTKKKVDPISLKASCIDRLKENIHFKFLLTVHADTFPCKVTSGAKFNVPQISSFVTKPGENITKTAANQGESVSEAKNVQVQVLLVSEEAQQWFRGDIATVSHQLYHDILFLWGEHADRPPFLQSGKVEEAFLKLATEETFEGGGTLLDLKREVFLPHL